jgi:hypothetical protein
MSASSRRGAKSAGSISTARMSATRAPVVSPICAATLLRWSR